MRVSRAAALVLVSVALGVLSLWTTSPGPTEAATLRAGMHTTAATAALSLPDGPKGHWQLVFSDHFAGNTVDPANWSTCYFFGCTDGGNNELEWYQASQVTVHDSTVSLTVVPA